MAYKAHKTMTPTQPFKPGQRLIEAVNPAEGKMIRVTFIRWFDSAHRYARVRYQNSGRCLSVPADTLLVE